MRRASTALLLACAALLGACGGEEETTTPAAESTPTQTTPTDPTPAGGEATATEAAVRVSLKDFKFIPRDVTVKRGDTITWVNDDTVQHNAVAEGEGPKSELFNQGESYSWTAEKSGKIPYVCTIHPGMEGTITVE